MTDKQIIIDGVPVQDCVFFYTDIQEEIACDLYPTCGGCLGIDCYYKQLLRKEQECEELKEKLIKWLGKEGLRQSEKEFYEQQLDQLKAENEELKKIIERLDVPKHEVIDMDIAFENAKLKAENEELREKCKKYGEINEQETKDYAELKAENEILEKVNKANQEKIKKIKEIAENGKRFAERWMITGEQKANVLTYANAILQKISECEVENEGN